jgi:GNAT superfamily N-acetyltransferase
MSASPLPLAPIALRPAQPGDCRALTDVAHAAKRVWGYPERWIQLWSPLLTITPDLLDRGSVIVAEVLGRDASREVVGFAAVILDGARASLDHLWVHPHAMRRGIGSALFDAAADTARRAGARFLLVESDPHAEEFYTRMGAIRIGEVYSTIDGERRVLPLMRTELDPS